MQEITLDMGDMKTWHCHDGCGGEIECFGTTAREAAQEYVDECDWPPDLETWWCNVYVRHVDEDGEDDYYDRVKIAVDPEEPPCLNDEDHDWQSPVEIVGGIRDNPGCYAHGGGVTHSYVCMRCGCGRTTNSWAQDMQDGTQGLDSIKYEPGRYDLEEPEED